jgi:hypothetical protein
VGAGPLDRRNFLMAGVAAAVGGLLAWRFWPWRRSPGPARPPPPPVPPPAGLAAVAALPTDRTRTWLGPPLWANRLQDWRLHGGRLECVAASGPMRTRTVAVLTRELVAGDLPGRIGVRTGLLAAGEGFSGFLVGAGAGRLDHRAAALVQGASGQGGGVLCTYEADGSVGFRDHTDEARQFAYAPIPGTVRSGPARPRAVDEDVELVLELAPRGRGRFRLRLEARDRAGAPLAAARLDGVDGAALVGGIALVSSSREAVGGARHWFAGLGAAGAKLARRPERAEGPILGTLYSLNRTVLKLTAQLFPIGDTDPRELRLQLGPRGGGDGWEDAATAPVGPGLAAVFRLTGWDGAAARRYRVRWAAGTDQEQAFEGAVHHRQPVLPPRRAGRGAGPAATPPAGRRRRPVLRAPAHHPRAGPRARAGHAVPLVPVAVGVPRPDQGGPHGGAGRRPRRLPPQPVGQRRRARARRRLPPGRLHAPGRLRQPGPAGPARPQPRPHDPAPVAQGIGVSFGAFRYGGVGFALVEDRKFKTGDKDNRDPAGRRYDLTILGDRQERFLAEWAAADPGGPKIVFSQTLWGCLQTDERGRAQFDSDADAAVAARRTALELVGRAGALLCSGDQHLASLVRHGLDGFDDGPVQFVAPAAGSAWQRWFEPAGGLPNPGGTANTGDFTDAYGNRMRVLAVANPRLTKAAFRAAKRGRNAELGDRRRKREGYGLVRVDKAARQFVIECWPWDGGPQFEGWPYRLPFPEGNGGEG